MADQIVIRAQEPDDADAIGRLLMQPGVLPATLQTPYTPLATRRTAAAEQPPGLHRLVAELDGVVVGSASLSVFPRPRRRHAGEIGLAVDDRYQRRGIGTALLGELIVLADRWLGLRRVELIVSSDNDHAIRLYERFGFAVEGRLREWALTDGRYTDVLVMGRLRDEAPDGGSARKGEE